MSDVEFSYQHASNVPEEIKNDFEARVKKQYQIVWEEMNRKNTVINVSWKVQDKELRGIFTADNDLHDSLKRNGLNTNI